ncbi:hypothetical protein SAMN05660206_103243 [Sphingobacterium wenxiniae]|uniref:Uncharacterized protein n=1 Tax=Sphingobacterium wenxiniae TaxID=683125 RepID=A0A1I6RA82_9SPHI|nr:hypothetical protein SAMN05660206_103243 [Sphingobacterium wenxiniae]
MQKTQEMLIILLFLTAFIVPRKAKKKILLPLLYDK